VKIKKPVIWGSYMGSAGNGIFGWIKSP